MRILVAARSLLSAGLAGIALLVALPAVAHWSPQELRAQQAQAALSARYAQLWAVLDDEPRRAFAAEQRRWINVARWQAQQACLAQRSVRDEAAAADCLAEVTLARLQTLPALRLTSR